MQSCLPHENDFICSLTKNDCIKSAALGHLARYHLWVTNPAGLLHVPWLQLDRARHPQQLGWYLFWGWGWFTANGLNSNSNWIYYSPKCWYSVPSRVSFSAFSWPRYDLENLSQNMSKEMISFAGFQCFQEIAGRINWPFPPPSITHCFPSPLGNRLLGWGNALPAADRKHFGKHSYTVIIRGVKKLKCCCAKGRFTFVGLSKAKSAGWSMGGFELHGLQLALRQVSSHKLLGVEWFWFWVVTTAALARGPWNP